MIDKEIATEWMAVVTLFVLLIVTVAYEILRKARYPLAAVIYFFGLLYIHKILVLQ